MPLLTKIIITAGLSIISASIILLYFTFDIIENQTKQIFKEKENQIKLVTMSTEKKFDEIIRILQTTSRLDELKNPKNVELISPELKGIPQDYDLETRKVAQSILEQFPELNNVAYTLPNGDMYFVEPYQSQLRLDSQNFAFRDWYKGVIQTNSAYLSEVFTAESTNEKTIKIALPIKDDSDNLIGIWGGIINLKFLEIDIARLPINEKSRIMIFDHVGELIIDTKRMDLSNNEKEVYYRYVINALKGNSGTAIDNIGNEKVFISYHAAKAGSLFWGSLIVEPYDVVFSSINYSSNQMFVAIVLVILIAVASTVLAIRSIKQNIKKSLEFQRENEEMIRTLVSLNKEYQKLEEKTLKKPKVKAIVVSKRHYFVIIIFVVIFTGMLNFYIFYQNQIIVYEIGLLGTPMKSGYVIQNLKGDTIDTWLSWKLPQGTSLVVNIVNSELVSPEKILAIKDSIISDEVIALDDSLLHKGPKGSISAYYKGWGGALKNISNNLTQFYLPHKIDIIESTKGEGSVLIMLTDVENADGYTGYTKSISDQNQILKSTITIYNADALDANQLGIIIRHEFGHALGLAHSTAPEDLMAPIIKTDYPYISECDLDALLKLYDGSKKSQVICEK